MAKTCLCRTGNFSGKPPLCAFNYELGGSHMGIPGIPTIVAGISHTQKDCESEVQPVDAAKSQGLSASRRNRKSVELD
jgi:hypothetical protein